MKIILIPVLLAAIGTSAGVGAGYFLKEAEQTDAEACLPATEKVEAKLPEEDTAFEYLKLNNQFVVPIVKDDRVQSLVVMTISLEVVEGNREQLFKREPKLRDAVLQVLFDHANIGGFSGQFTDAPQMSALRKRLLDATRTVSGDIVNDVLIADILRRDN